MVCLLGVDTELISVGKTVRNFRDSRGFPWALLDSCAWSKARIKFKPQGIIL